MENAEVINILNITLPEIKAQRVFLRQEVDRVQCLRLGFTNGRGGGGARKTLETGEVATGVLDDDLVVEVEEEWAGGVVSSPKAVPQNAKSVLDRLNKVGMYVLVERPRLSERLDQIRSILSKVIIDLPTTANLRRSALLCHR